MENTNNQKLNILNNIDKLSSSEEQQIEQQQTLQQQKQIQQQKEESEKEQNLKQQESQNQQNEQKQQPQLQSDNFLSDNKSNPNNIINTLNTDKLNLQKQQQQIYSTPQQQLLIQQSLQKPSNQYYNPLLQQQYQQLQSYQQPQANLYAIQKDNSHLPTFPPQPVSKNILPIVDVNNLNTLKHNNTNNTNIVAKNKKKKYHCKNFHILGFCAEPSEYFETVEEAKKFYDYHEQFLFECLSNDKLDFRNPEMIYKHLKRKHGDKLEKTAEENGFSQFVEKYKTLQLQQQNNDNSFKMQRQQQQPQINTSLIQYLKGYNNNYANHFIYQIQKQNYIPEISTVRSQRSQRSQNSQQQRSAYNKDLNVGQQQYSQQFLQQQMIQRKKKIQKMPSTNQNIIQNKRYNEQYQRQNNTLNMGYPENMTNMYNTDYSDNSKKQYYNNVPQSTQQESSFYDYYPNQKLSTSNSIKDNQSTQNRINDTLYQQQHQLYYLPQNTDINNQYPQQYFYQHDKNLQNDDSNRY